MDDARSQPMNRPPRFAIRSDAIDGRSARLQSAELHHLRDVMRLRIGARVALFDERGVEHLGTLTRLERDAAMIEISEPAEHAPESHRILLAAAVIKGPRMDFLIEKATELGAAELWPILCARGVVRDPGAQRLARWRRLVTAAAKQSLAACPMQIRAPLRFADLIQTAPADTLGVMCAIGGEPLGPLIRRTKPRRLLIVCGPEGDFDPEEIALAKRAGFLKAGLGTNRLRSETAAIAALSIARAALDEIEQEPVSQIASEHDQDATEVDKARSKPAANPSVRAVQGG
jgi:16S rRNA (uracil1498-N3)-methyltransferase